METTIRLSTSVKNQLDKMKIYSKESYNDIIEFLLEDHMELSEKTKKELKERERNPKFISHEEVGRKLGL